jgi:hypothetical protein
VIYRLSAVLLVLLASTASHAATTLDFELKGIFSEQGLNNAAFGAGPGNVLVGKSGTLPPTRNYFVFDLAQFDQLVYSASLVVEMPFRGYNSPQGTETWALYDVTSDIAILQNQFSIDPSVYVDLGSGTEYGAEEVTQAEQFMDVVVDLNASALSDLNASRGGLFAIGGALTTLDGGQESLFGFSNNSHRAQLVLNQAPPAEQTIDISPTVDALATLTDGTFVVTDGQNSINTQRIPDIDLDRRGILEFDIGDIPSGSSISAASLTLSVNTITHTETEYPQPLFYGYAGDGAATTADAGETAILLQESDPILGSAIRTFDFDPALFQSTFGDADFAGLLIVGSENFRQTGFWTSEASGFAMPPTLSITFTPPGGELIGDYNKNGVVDAADYALWRETLGQSGHGLAADGNDNDQIDDGDYAVWRAHFGNKSALAATIVSAPRVAVPEPSSTTLWLLSLSAAAFCLISNRPSRLGSIYGTPSV